MSLPQHSRIDKKEHSVQERIRYWEIADHCSSAKFPASYPEIHFDVEFCNLLYLQFITNSKPGYELAHLIRQAHSNVLARLNHSKLQVRNFILPVELIKLKYIDPYSRQRIVKQMCSYLSSQICLRNVVLEQAEVTFTDLCLLLLAIGRNAQIRRLYLWHVLAQCQFPFKGPLQSKINSDNLRRIPFTYIPGGRKVLRKVEQIKSQMTLNSENMKREDVTDIGSELIENYYLDDKIHCKNTNGNDRVKDLSKPIERHSRVYTQVSVAVQCNMSHESVNDKKMEEIFSQRSVVPEFNNSIKSNIDILMKKEKAEFCMDYLKFYENSSVDIEILREIYKIALNQLLHLRTLSLNYCLLADGTGSTLMSIGSLLNGTLWDLEILCELKELPSAAHKQYYIDANHAIPDVVWRNVKEKCPNLKVHMVLVCMLPHDITKMFLTKSVPLCSFNIDSAFCTTLFRPQIAFFSTLKFLRLCFKETLQHVNILIWHSSGKIDSSLELLIKETQLHSFVYYGPLQYKATVSKLCDAALLSSSKLAVFKLAVRGDPCYPSIAEKLTEELQKKYEPMFFKKNIQFSLGICSSEIEKEMKFSYYIT